MTEQTSKKLGVAEASKALLGPDPGGEASPGINDCQKNSSGIEQEKEIARKVFSPSDIANKLKSSGKMSGAEILNKVLDEKGAKNISSVVAYAQVHINANFLEDNGFPELGQLDRAFANLIESYGVGVGGKRAKEVLEATKFELERQHDLDKMKGPIT